MKAYAINGQTAGTKGFSGIFYRAGALLAGFDAGTFLTEAAVSNGGFRLEGEADFFSRWTGAGSNVMHANFHANRLELVCKVARETARVLRWAALDGEQVTNQHRARVALLAKERHGKRDAFVKAFGLHGAALLAMTSDSEAVALAVETLRTPDGSAGHKAWQAAYRAAKASAFVTI